MGIVILVLVSIFHAAVFCGLSYWIAGSKEFKMPAKLVAIWFVVGAALANVVLCIMLFELFSGITTVAGGEVGDGNGLGHFMRIVLVVQPFFALALYPVVSGIIKRRPLIVSN